MGNNDWSIKELVSAILSLAIVGATIWLMTALFDEAATATAETYQRHAALQQAAIGFAGTILGYYFGRVPAERNVQATQRNASEAQKLLVTTATQAATSAASASRAHEAKQRAAQQISDLRQHLFPDSPTGAGASAAMPSHPDDGLKLRLDQILRELS